MGQVEGLVGKFPHHSVRQTKLASSSVNFWHYNTVIDCLKNVLYYCPFSL